MLLWLWIMVAPALVLLADSRDARVYLLGLTRSWREPTSGVERPAIDARVSPSRPYLSRKDGETSTEPASSLERPAAEVRVGEARRPLPLGDGEG